MTKWLWFGLGLAVGALSGWVLSRVFAQRCQCFATPKVRGKEAAFSPPPPERVPCARFNSEGAFSEVPIDFSWSPAYEEELYERLNRLMG